MTSSVDNTVNNSPVVKGKSNEIAILVSDIVTYENNIAKLILPSMTPTMTSDAVVENKVPTQTSRIINRDNLDSKSITTSNYVEVNIPHHLFTIKEIQITTNARNGGECGGILSCRPVAKIIYNEFLKGQQFIVTRDIYDSRPYIIGVIE